MRKLSLFKPELVTQTFPEEDLKKNPSKINKGNCMRWAIIAYYMFQGVELWYMGAHAFIRYQGKFYDSERLEGVEDWKDLPACNFGRGCGCRLCSKGAAKHSEKEFREFWNSNYIKPNWGSYVHMAQEAVKRYESGQLEYNSKRA